MASDEIQHIVVTRFSMPVPEHWRRKAYGDEENRPKWLAYRARLLEATLAPCLRHQERRPTTAYLICDSEDADFCRQNIDQGLFTILYCSRYGGNRLAGEDLVRRGTRGPVSLSRIDSDDLVSKNYFQELDSAIRLQDAASTWFVAVNGYRSDFRSLQRVYYNCSPFLSLYVREYSGEDIYAFSHELVIDKPHVQMTRAEWMQVIHGRNVGNAFGVQNFPTANFEQRRARNQKMVTEIPGEFSAAWFRDWAGFDAPNALPEWSMAPAEAGGLGN